MSWILIVAIIGIVLIGFWPVYDRVKKPNYKITNRAKTQDTPYAVVVDEKPWTCPVCGESHNNLSRHGSCPFANGEYYAVPEDDMLDSMFTNTGGHFEFRFYVWQYKDMIYLTYKNDDLAVLNDKDGRTLVSAYYSTRFCSKEDWDPDSVDMRYEMSGEVMRLRERTMDSIYETDNCYIVGLSRILDMAVTKKASCAKTGYVIWRGNDEINVTGIRTGASADIFNYDKISRSDTIHRFDKPYTRRLCGTLEELRELPQEVIDGTAYGAYMDGAR